MGDEPIGSLGEVDAIPREELRRVGALRRVRCAAERRHVEVVWAGATATERGQRRVAETIFAGRGNQVGDGAVDVGVEDGRAGVGPPDLAEHPVEGAVMKLGELVEQRDAAGLPVVVVCIAGNRASSSGSQPSGSIPVTTIELAPEAITAVSAERVTATMSGTKLTASSAVRLLNNAKM